MDHLGGGDSTLAKTKGRAGCPERPSKRCPCSKPRRLPRMTHFCSPTVTRTKNTIWRRARTGQTISSTPQACGVISHHPRRRRVRLSVSRGKRSNRAAGERLGPTFGARQTRSSGPATAFGARQAPPLGPARWVTFGEQTRVNSRECRRKFDTERGSLGHRSSVPGPE